MLKMILTMVYNDINLFTVNPVLIEKILRTEPDVGKMYLLIKAKNKQAAMERLQNEVFFLMKFSFLHVAFDKFHGFTYLLISLKFVCFRS